MRGLRYESAGGGIPRPLASVPRASRRRAPGALPRATPIFFYGFHVSRARASPAPAGSHPRGRRAVPCPPILAIPHAYFHKCIIPATRRRLFLSMLQRAGDSLPTLPLIPPLALREGGKNARKRNSTLVALDPKTISCRTSRLLFLSHRAPYETRPPPH